MQSPSNGTVMAFICLVACVLIAVFVWALFLLGNYLGVQWYVSAVAILLMGRFVIGFLERM